MKPQITQKRIYLFFAILIGLQAAVVCLPLVYLILVVLYNEPAIAPSPVLMLAGCVGAWFNLKTTRSRKLDRINFILLFLGLIGITFGAVLGVMENANWRQTELIYALFFIIPTVHAALCARLCFLRLKRNDGEYDLKAWEITQKTSATPCDDSARVPDRSS